MSIFFLIPLIKLYFFVYFLSGSILNYSILNSILMSINIIKKLCTGACTADDAREHTRAARDFPAGKDRCQVLVDLSEAGGMVGTEARRAEAEELRVPTSDSSDIGRKGKEHVR